MAKYFFSENSLGNDFGVEDDWLEFSSLQAACDDADRALRSIAASAPLETSSFAMTVFDTAFTAVHHTRIDARSGCDPRGG